MKKVNPEINQQLLEEIQNQTSEIVTIDGVKIKTRKNVFPPISNFSRSSEKLHKLFGDLHGLRVLDVGTGTGVQAIQAAAAGAITVVALDISPEAISCAKENVILNNMEDTISVLESDLFAQVEPGSLFDVVIANLPITDFPIRGMVESAIYDAEYEVHTRFLSKVGEYMAEHASIIIPHINFKGEDDFNDFEKMLAKYGFVPEDSLDIQNMGYTWRLYRLKRVGDKLTV